MMSTQNFTPGEVIARVGKGLNRDKLAYFVREGYIQPEKVQRGGQFYKFFRESDIWILDRAMTYIQKYQTTPRAAFDKARSEYAQASQTELPLS
jgi:DNA-binding transcriptional MerR regulator